MVTSMFTETDGSRKAIGDVDVLYHDGLYHLFHLVLPNHDFIAHAVSTDGIRWRRVRNAIFIGDPGSWDDLMLWTMHISPDPHKADGWRMFYTGITRRDRGKIQRLGLALSDDLYHWHKHPVNWEDLRGPDDPEAIKHAREISQQKEDGEHIAKQETESCFPLGATPEHYESTTDEGRGVVSFRDPYFFTHENKNWLLAAARVNQGPIVRRGCVALMEEVSPYHFVLREPLLHPGLYDDVEVPNVFEINDQCYLIGSIREDAKIRYWYHSEECRKWLSHHDNVLMPQGNYAARVCRDSKGWLLWCFFSMHRTDRTQDNLMPPPKRLARAKDGLLYLKTYEELEKWTKNPCDHTKIVKLKPNDSGQAFNVEGDSWELESSCSFQGFLFDSEYQNFWLKCRIAVDGKGKCGLLFRIDPETHDGYYLSLDLLKGVAQLRAWGTNHEMHGEHMMSFTPLQSSFWATGEGCGAEISLICFGSYIELSIDGRILLSLADHSFSKGLAGIYLESCKLTAHDILMRPMHDPEQVDDQLVGG